MFAEKLKMLRREKNITQEEFAKALKVTKGAVAMWETDKRTPDVDMLKKIADYFHVSVDYLIGNKNESAIEELSSKGFFRLKKGLEPYDISESDAEFLLSVYKAHIESNK